MMRYGFNIFGFFTLHLVVALSSPKEEATQKVLSILRDPTIYDKDVMPYPRNSGPLIVTMNLMVRNIDFPKEDNNMHLDVTFRMEWEDPRLFYSSPGVSHVSFIDASKFWIPDAFFKSSDVAKMSSVTPENYIRVYPKGGVLYSTRLTIVTKCHMNFRKFPFDAQECPLYIASYGYNTKDMVFMFREFDPLQISKRLWTTHFILNNLTTDSCLSKTNTGEYSCLVFNFHFLRESSYYIFRWHIPCIMLVVVAFLSGLLDSSAIVPRLLLTLGPLLAMQLFLCLEIKIPAPISYTTTMDIFTGISMTTIFATFVLVLISYRCHASQMVENGNSKFRLICLKMKRYGSCIPLAIIIISYGIFLFVHFANQDI